MGWWNRRRVRAQVAREDREVSEVLRRHLVDFAHSRRGVEAWIEQPTNFNKPSILLVAADGESTRRAIPSAEFGYQLAEQLRIPGYDAGVVPYPQRLRDYGKQRKPRPDWS